MPELKLPEKAAPYAKYIFTQIAAVVVTIALVVVDQGLDPHEPKTWLIVAGVLFGAPATTFFAPKNRSTSKE